MPNVDINQVLPNLRGTRIVPQLKNPLDKATIVSIFHKDINEIKHTIFPGVFHIDRAAKGDYSILVVGTSSWWKEMEEGQPFLEIPSSAITMAESVIKDYCNGLFGCNMADKMPGIFYVPGEYTKESVKLAPGFIVKLAEAHGNQKRWFSEIVKLADVMWAETKGNPLAISDDARYAAQFLGLMDKPWLQDFQAAQLVNCPACGEMINPSYPVCKHCHHVVDVEKAKSLNLKFASE